MLQANNLFIKKQLVPPPQNSHELKTKLYFSVISLNKYKLQFNMQANQMIYYRFTKL